MDYNAKIDVIKGELSDMVSAAREEGRGLTEEEKQTAAAKTAEIESLRAAAELAGKVDAWDAAAKDEIRKARKIEDVPAADNGDAEERAALLDYIKRGQVVGTAGYGGYLVPEKIREWVVAKRDAESYVRRLGTVINITGPTKIPAEGTDAVAYWTAEGAAYTDTIQQFISADLTPRKLTILDKISEELIADTAADFDVVGYLLEKCAKIIGQTEETAFIKGSSGNGEPSGILSQGITPSRLASNSAVTIDEIQGFFYSLDPEYQKNATWLISADLAAKLSALTTGTGGIFAWGTNLSDTPGAVLCGRPCYISKDLDAMGSAAKNIAILGDFSYYFIGDQGGLRIQRMDEAFAANGQIALRLTELVAGNCVNSNAFKVLTTKAS